MSNKMHRDTHRLVEEMKREEWRSPSARMIRQENARLHYEAEAKAYREHEKRMRDEVASRERRARRTAYYANHLEIRDRHNKVSLIIAAIATVAVFLFMVFDGHLLGFFETIGILLVVFLVVWANLMGVM